MKQTTINKVKDMGMGLVLRHGFLRSALFIYFFISSFVPGKQSESIVYENIRGCCGHCFSGVSAACSYERRDFYICSSPNRQIYAQPLVICSLGGHLL